MHSLWRKVLGLAVLPALAYGYASTDMPQDADALQSGYLPNHNIDPASVASSLAISWTNAYNSEEVFYAKPLIYTPSTAPHEYVIVVSNQNNVRVLDGMTGALITQRTLQPPFSSSDTDCGDIPNTVGITGTPIIDTTKDIMYLFSKGYHNGQAGPQGTINGVYKMYALNIPSLTDVAGFPVTIDGHAANNDGLRYFVGGTVLQRPGLAMIGNTIVAGFGGHCDNFNYTGMLVAVSTVAGVGVTNIQAMITTPGVEPGLDITQQTGGKAGIWHSGMGLAADTANDRVFFVTGNARGAGANGGSSGKAASGKVHLNTLEQAACNFAVNPSTGSLTQSDYFESYAYDSLNGGDRDFGSSGIALLDSTTFNGNGITRLAVAGGKDGRVYVLNADNMGGFAGGNAGGDNVVQVITNPTGLYAGVGSYPLEGGYIYMNPSNDVLYAYSFSNANGVPKFTLAGKSANTFAAESVPTVTSNNGQAGTGIVWLADTNVGLVAFKAVPVNGVLVQITLPSTAQTGGVTKYTRATFGNARIYTVRGVNVIALGGGGSATSPALTCTPNPIAFGNVNTGSTSVVELVCKANTAITNLKCTTAKPTFQCPSGIIAANVASGASVTIPITFNLTQAAETAYTNGNFGTIPGAESDTADITATAGAGFIGSAMVPLSGTAVATGGYLTISVMTVSFGGVAVGSTGTATFTLTNKGQGALTFTGFDWYDYYVKPTTYNNVTVAGGVSTVGNSYTATNFPAVGATLAAGASLTISVKFSPTTMGQFATYLYFYSNGGSTDILFQGNAQSAAATSTSKKASSTSSNSKISLTSSGKVSTTSSSKISLTASPKSSTLATVTTTAVNPVGSLNPNELATIGTWDYIGCYQDLVNNVRTLSSPQLNDPAMTLAECAKNCAGYNFFGTTYGTECYCGYTLNTTLRATESNCNTPCAGNATEICGTRNRLSMYQNTIHNAPPAAPSHVPEALGYVWQGCYTEATNGRALSSKSTSYTTQPITVESCLQFCAGYTYAGMEYAQECYCGNTLGAGSVLTTTSSCSMVCEANSLEYCGGGSKLDMYMYNPKQASSISASLHATTTAPPKSSVQATSTSSTVKSSTSTTSTSCPIATAAAATTHTYTWSVGWVRASPDGYARPFVGINGQWPLPAITVNMGDTISITVTNNLGNETTAIHFHGIFQQNSTYADGPAMVTQCPIQPGGSFVYTFTVNQPGTYWYHAHIGGQYIDGFRGPLIINDVKAPYCVDETIVMTLSDLYHLQAPQLINYYQSSANANNNNGAEPVPDSILINEAQNVQFTILPGKKYLFRIISMAAYAPMYLQFDQHNMSVVEIDGVYVKPVSQNQLFIAPAQRYSVIITAKTTTTANFIVRASMSTSMFNPAVIPSTINYDVTGWLVYNTAVALPAASTFKLTPQPFDDSIFIPVDQMAALAEPENAIYLTVDFGPNNNNQYRGYMNGISYVAQTVPTLYTVLSAPASERDNPTIYGTNSNPFVLTYGQVVEIDITNHDSKSHPFHLHGHNFQVIDRSDGGALFPINIPNGPPMRRDTFMLMAEGYATLRFVADNPGVMLFHCHIEWHVESGLTATFIEAPDQLVASKPVIPASHKSVCAAQGIPTVGNAAGVTSDYTNVTNAPTVPALQLWGALVNPPKTPAAAYPPNK